MKSIIILLSGVLFFSCKEPSAEIKFVNNSDILLDSVTINIHSANSYSKTIQHVKPWDSVVALIPKNSPRSNNHDITVAITIFIKNEKPIFEYSYNDLSGYLNSNYTIRMNERKQLIWENE